MSDFADMARELCRPWLQHSFPHGHATLESVVAAALARVASDAAKVERDRCIEDVISPKADGDLNVIVYLIRQRGK